VDAVRYLMEKGANIEAKNIVRDRSCIDPVVASSPDWLVRRPERRRSTGQLLQAKLMPSSTWWRRVPT
jgi:hypothetical protein